MALHVPADYRYNLSTGFYSCLCCTYPPEFLSHILLSSFLSHDSFFILPLEVCPGTTCLWQDSKEGQKMKAQPQWGQWQHFQISWILSEKNQRFLKAVGVRSKITLWYLAYNSRCHVQKNELKKPANGLRLLGNHRMVWVGRDLKHHLVPTPLPWAGTLSTRPGCSELHPTWPWTLPGRGHPQLLWATCSSISPPSWWRISS